MAQSGFRSLGKYLWEVYIESRKGLGSIPDVRHFRPPDRFLAPFGGRPGGPSSPKTKGDRTGPGLYGHVAPIMGTTFRAGGGPPSPLDGAADPEDRMLSRSSQHAPSHEDPLRPGQGSAGWGDPNAGTTFRAGGTPPSMPVGALDPKNRMLSRFSLHSPPAPTSSDPAGSRRGSSPHLRDHFRWWRHPLLGTGSGCGCPQPRSKPVLTARAQGLSTSSTPLDCPSCPLGTPSSPLDTPSSPLEDPLMPAGARRTPPHAR